LSYVPNSIVNIIENGQETAWKERTTVWKTSSDARIPRSSPCKTHYWATPYNIKRYHDLLYKGPLPRWTAFSEDVERFYFHQVLINRAIYDIGRAAEGNETINEFVAVVQESVGVQSCFMHSIGTVLGGILSSVFNIARDQWIAEDNGNNKCTAIISGTSEIIYPGLWVVGQR
jgi:hypothetical protein